MPTATNRGSPRARPGPRGRRSGSRPSSTGRRAEFNAYVDREGADPVADLVGYRQHGIWLTEAELHQLIEGMRAAILPALSNEAAPGRSRYLLSPILFPVEDDT
ncbi:hypothetical protein ACWEOO_37760 [Kribbella sp. NPDC004138]